MIEVRVQSLGLDQASKTPVVILQEADGERVLPIWIGPGEASAIAMELAGMKFARPLTHDLTASIIRSMGGELQSVVISRVEENTYYAELTIRHGADTVAIDARPSDSIAIALRLQARLFTTEDLLSATTIEIAESELPTEIPEEPEPGGTKLSPEQLQDHLRKMNPEDFGRFTP
jgi:uncharacterized protein